MVIVIDIGNTNVALAGIEAEQVLCTAKVPTVREWDAEIYAEKLRPLISDWSCRGGILSSVVPQISEAVAEAVGRITGRRPILMTAQTKTGLEIALPAPEKVGRDRLADALWAAKHVPLPAVTADLGTATTLNVILPGNIFAGGIICAGMQTGLLALAQRAAQLPRLKLKISDSVIGRSTEEAMLSGAIAGTAAMLDGLVTDIEEELGSPVSLVITGGGGRYAAPLVRHAHVFDPDVTLKGLALIYERNV